MASTLRAHGPRVAHVRPLQRHSVSYAFSVFPSVRPATAALQRPRDERWRKNNSREPAPEPPEKANANSKEGVRSCQYKDFFFV